jgi:hypothetical protein
MWNHCRLGSIGCAFLEYSLVDFFPMDLDLTRGIDPDTYLIPSHAH